MNAQHPYGPGPSTGQDPRPDTERAAHDRPHDQPHEHADVLAGEPAGGPGPGSEAGAIEPSRSVAPDDQPSQPANPQPGPPVPTPQPGPPVPTPQPGPPVPTPPVPTPPQTGDIDLDTAMADLAQAQRRSLEERIDSGERVHRLLQGRLSDLGRA